MLNRRRVLAWLGLAPAAVVVAPSLARDANFARNVSRWPSPINALPLEEVEIYEDDYLTDLIYEIEPTDTPFLNSADLSEATAVRHEWQTAALQSRAR